MRKTNDPPFRKRNGFQWLLQSHGQYFLAVSCRFLLPTATAVRLAIPVCPTVNMFLAAFTSAFSSYPQAVHLNTACNCLFSFAPCPQHEQVCDVYR